MKQKGEVKSRQFPLIKETEADGCADKNNYSTEYVVTKDGRAKMEGA